MAIIRLKERNLRVFGAPWCIKMLVGNVVKEKRVAPYVDSDRRLRSCKREDTRIAVKHDKFLPRRKLPPRQVWTAPDKRCRGTTWTTCSRVSSSRPSVPIRLHTCPAKIANHKPGNFACYDTRKEGRKRASWTAYRRKGLFPEGRDLRDVRKGDESYKRKEGKEREGKRDKRGGNKDRREIHGIFYGLEF